MKKKYLFQMCAVFAVLVVFTSCLSLFSLLQPAGKKVAVPKVNVFYDCNIGNEERWETETFGCIGAGQRGSGLHVNSHYKDSGKTHKLVGVGAGTFVIADDTITFVITRDIINEKAVEVTYTGNLTDTGMTMNGKTYRKRVVMR
jgi:hypothetical protein